MSFLIRNANVSMIAGGLTSLHRARYLALDGRGGMFIEMILVVLVFSLVGTAVLAGVSGTRISGAKTENQSVAENIARNQMEYAFSLPYQEPPSSYPSISVPNGYGVTCTSEEYEANNPDIEKVVVTVSFQGQQRLVLETLRSRG